MAIFQRGFAHIRNKKRVPELASAIGALEEWFDTPVGQRLLEEEQSVLDEELSCLFGYHLMQLSINRKARLYEGSRISHCFSVGAATSDSPSDVGVYSALDELPLEDESVDVTVLHHVLEFSSNPHQVLREASRVTIARGYIVVVGFNPFSPMGFVKPFAQIFSSSPIWRRSSLRKSRVADWLQFLDCNTVRSRSSFYSFPWQNKPFLDQGLGLDRLLKRWHFPLGNFYCLVARKDRNCMMPIKPEWSAGTRLKVPAPKQAVSARSTAKMAVIKGSKPQTSSK